MNKLLPFLSLILILVPACNKKAANSILPTYKLAHCTLQSFSINFDSASYSLNGLDFQSFDNQLQAWIPSEDSPVFYILSYTYDFCDYLHLNLGNYSYELEKINNPNGYWYEITTEEEVFSEILNGNIITGQFKYWKGTDFTTDIDEPSYD